ncbi:MAG: hypothetical protein NTX73_16475 [Rhodobacterales bacterium]|nr:hypothetical protein [Rhodobacterales bacterium]
MPTLPPGWHAAVWQELSDRVAMLLMPAGYVPHPAWSEKRDGFESVFWTGPAAYGLRIIQPSYHPNIPQIHAVGSFHAMPDPVGTSERLGTDRQAWNDVLAETEAGRTKLGGESRSIYSVKGQPRNFRIKFDIVARRTANMEEVLAALDWAIPAMVVDVGKLAERDTNPSL